MKCHPVSGKNKKNITFLSSAELAQRRILPTLYKMGTEADCEMVCRRLELL